MFEIGRAPDNQRLATLTAYKLGLWPLDLPAACMGFQNGCVCQACTDRPKAERPTLTRQPWEPIPLKAEPVRLSGDQQLAFWRGRLTRGEYVYFIQPANGGPVKIGRAHDPIGRLRQLQTGSPVELVLRWVIPSSSDAERRFHKRFADMRTRGEWFDGPELELLVAFAEAISQHMIDVYEGSGELPALPEPDDPARTPEVLAEARKDIEAMYHQGLSDGEIAGLLSGDGDPFSVPLGGREWSSDEVRDQLAFMRQTPAFHVPWPRPTHGFNRHRAHDKRAFRLRPDSRAA